MKKELSSTLFVALQCCQCSTMQVKQQKKSSNKWVCVICNQKQSIRKVFAQGYKAKELRLFVQSFNMSRKSLEEEHAAADTLPQVDVDEDTPADLRKRRTDWSEYLDRDPPNYCRRSPQLEASEEGIDPKIVTEMPKDMFKRPKLNKNFSAGVSSWDTGGGEEDGHQLYKPVFSRRSINKQELRSEKVSKRQSNMKQRNLVPGGVSKLCSKWKAYLTQEEEEEEEEAEEEENGTPLRLGQREALRDDDAQEWSSAVLEISTADQTVDDEVHPDFK